MPEMYCQCLVAKFSVLCNMYKFFKGPSNLSLKAIAYTDLLQPGLWCQKSQHSTLTLGNFNYQTPNSRSTLTFSCISYLTLLEPPGFGNFRKKNSSFWLHNQRPSSSAHCARELFSGSNGSASLVDCTRKKIFCLGGAVFFWVTS